MQQNFKKCSVEYGVYVRCKQRLQLLVVCLYIHDLLVRGTCSQEIEEFKLRMQYEFEMTNLGRLSYFLGLELVKTPDGVILH